MPHKNLWQQPKYLAQILWALGLAIVTFDMILTLEVNGFTIKSYYFIFLLSAGISFFTEIHKQGFVPFVRESLQVLLRPPWIFIVLLYIYATAFSPFSFFPLKSFAYSAWGWFDILIIFLGGYWALKGSDLKMIHQSLLYALIFLCVVVLIDHVAYFYGYHDGFVGFNQGPRVDWKMSRPYAFAYEPSYLAVYFSFAICFLYADLCFSEKKLLPTKLTLFTLALSCFCLLIIASRSGWLASFFHLSILSIIMIRLKKAVPKILKKIILALPLLLLLLLIVSPKKQLAVMNQKLVSSVLKGMDGAGNARINSMKSGLKMSQLTHYMGTGLGASYAYWVYHSLDKSSGFPKKYKLRPQDYGSEVVMSIWAQLLAELGLIGVCLYVLFALSFVYFLWQAFTIKGTSLTATAFVTALTFFFFTAHWLGNVARSDIWVWFTLWYTATQTPTS